MGEISTGSGERVPIGISSSTQFCYLGMIFKLDVKMRNQNELIPDRGSSWAKCCMGFDSAQQEARQETTFSSAIAIFSTRKRCAFWQTQMEETKTELTLRRCHIALQSSLKPYHFCLHFASFCPRTHTTTSQRSASPTPPIACPAFITPE